MGGGEWVGVGRAKGAWWDGWIHAWMDGGAAFLVKEGATEGLTYTYIYAHARSNERGGGRGPRGLFSAMLVLGMCVCLSPPAIPFIQPPHHRPIPTPTNCPNT